MELPWLEDYSLESVSGGGDAMEASSSSSAPACIGALAGAVPTADERQFRGHGDVWSWRGRVANALFDRKMSAAEDVPADVEARSPIERALNAYSFGQAGQGSVLQSFFPKGSLIYTSANYLFWWCFST